MKPNYSESRAKARVERRFWDKVVKADNGCWMWTGGKRAQMGYGNFRINIDRPAVYAHRFSYELVHGSIPSRMCVCHTCDQPLCVNPDHLKLGTSGDNFAEMRAKGRHAHGSTHGHAKLTEKQVKDIRHIYETTGQTQQEIGDTYGVSFRAISLIVNRKAWKHI